MSNAIETFQYTDILGWSVSRYDTFTGCKRQYFYDYYGKHDTTIPRSKIDSLKKLTSVPLEAGNIVHDTIKVLLERLLKSESPIDKNKFLDYARRKTTEYCNAKTFAEVYYKDKTSISTDEVAEKVKQSLTNFLQSDRFNWIVQKALTNKTNWVIEPPGYGETRIDGMKAYCKVDFLFPIGDEIFILDWKTGKKDDRKHKKQLFGYSLWASYHFQKEPNKIFPIIVYLQPAYDELLTEVNEFDLQEFSNRVKQETQDMYNFCKIIEQNIPKQKDFFAKTTNTNICRFCKYRELCSM